MIRQFNEDDVIEINAIGNRIKENFDIKKIYNKNVENIYIYEQNKKIIGFIHISNILNDVDILNIAVLEQYEHHQVATSLINYVIKKDKTNKIMLEVRESNNKAINLYKKLGFNIIHIRNNYYGSDNALIMELILK